MPDTGPDFPVVRVVVDGKDPFAAAAPEWRGFDPERMLGPGSPLLPVDLGRRVAIYRCSCGGAGCGVIAPSIVPSPDGRHISWVDFRDYVGIFADPLAESVDEHDGQPWPLPDLHFARDQNTAEIERATRDRSWETARRKTARLLYEHLAPMGLVLPPNLGLARTEPAWHEEGVTLMFEHQGRAPHLALQQQRLRLTSEHHDPERAAEDMAKRLDATCPGDWASTFGWRST